MIHNCLKGDREARKELYARYAPQMMSVCRRYLHDEDDVKDVFQEAFFNVFKNLKQLKDPNALSGWVKRIFVNMALARIKDKKRLVFTDQITHSKIELGEVNDAIDNMAVDQILELIAKLPTGSRTVFNLYAIEGYSHQEIADHLHISVGTSKSQLHDARKRLQESLLENESVKIKINA